MGSTPLVGVVASAGGVEPLQAFVKALPDDFRAAVFVLVHVSPDEPSALPSILGRAGKLPAAHPEDGALIEPGHIVVAMPGLHLSVADGRIRLGSGPKERGHRPSADLLLRSIALEVHEFGAGVVLSGMMDDGALGLRAIANAGGFALVQDPREADFAAMPKAAIALSTPDVVAPVATLTEEPLRLGRPPDAEPLELHLSRLRWLALGGPDG